MAYKALIAWHVMIVNNTIVRAGCDLLCIIGTQEQEEKKWAGKAQIFTYYAKSKRTALKDCISHRPGIHLCTALSEETNVWTVQEHLI